MLILQSGLPKSGNLWLYKIIQESLLQKGIVYKSFIQTQSIYQEAKLWPGFADQAGIDYLEVEQQGTYYRKGAFRQPILDLNGYLAQCTHVWTHAFWLPRCEEVFRNFDKIVYIVRDPRDVIVSASRYFFTPFMLNQHPQQEPDSKTFLKHRLYEQILTWVQHTGGYLLHEAEFHIHFIFYERLLHDFDNEYQHLLDYLGITLPLPAILQIKETVRFENMKKQNPYHLRKGESGGWVNELTTGQAQQIVKMAGPMMRILSYPIKITTSMNDGLPKMPESVEKRQVLEAISTARGGILEKMRYAWAFAISRRSFREKLARGVEFLRGRGRWDLTP